MNSAQKLQLEVVSGREFEGFKPESAAVEEFVPLGKSMGVGVDNRRE